MAGEHHVGGEKHVVPDHAVMANMITRPKNNVVADWGEWLEGIVFQNEAVVSDLGLRPNRRSGADIANEAVPLGFYLIVDTLSQAIHLAVGHGSKEHVIGRGILVLDSFH